MGNEFEVWKYVSVTSSEASEQSSLEWIMVYAGDNRDEANDIMLKLKNENQEPCIKLIWR